MPKKKKSSGKKSELIKNYGLYWDAGSINWGRKKKNEIYRLAGYSSNKKKRWAAFDKQIAIYILYDPNLRPIYIGQVGSGNQGLYARLKQHKTTDHLVERWEKFSWFGLLKVNNGKDKGDKQYCALEGRDASKVFSAAGNILLDQFESILLAGAEPSLNKQGPKWHKAEHFKQKNIKPTIDSEILKIKNNLEKIQKAVGEINNRKRKKAK